MNGSSSPTCGCFIATSGFTPASNCCSWVGEFAQEGEWNASEALPWARAEEPRAKGITQLIRALNELQSRHPALSEWDCDRRGFEWLDGDDAAHSALSFLRHASDESLVVVFNFTPTERIGYRIPIHAPGRYELDI